MAKELTQEERERRNAYKREWARAKAAKLKAAEAGVPEAMTTKSLYEENQNLKATVEQFKAQITEIQKICQSYAQKAADAENLLKQATLEYNARTKYMLDCVKHTYLSIQFAEAAAKKENLDD